MPFGASTGGFFWYAKGQIYFLNLRSELEIQLGGGNLTVTPLAGDPTSFSDGWAGVRARRGIVSER